MRVTTKLIALTLALLFIGSIGAVAVSARSTEAAPAAAGKIGAPTYYVGQPSLITHQVTTQTPKVNTEITYTSQLAYGQTGLIGASITVHKQKVTAGSPDVVVGTYTTDASGYITAKIKFESSGGWHVWSVYNGGSVWIGAILYHFNPSSSSSMGLNAWSTTPGSKKSSNSNMWASTQKPTVGTNFVLGGYLQSFPNDLAGKTVTIYFQQKGNVLGTWGPKTTAGSVKTTGTGTWQKTVKVNSDNYIKFWAVFAGDTGNYGSTSNVVNMLPVS